MLNIIHLSVLVVLIQGSWSFATKPSSGIPFITGGSDAFPGQFPYQALVLYGVPPVVKYKPICGGSIINEQWILTSGQCVTMIPNLGKAIVKVGKQELRHDSEYVQTSEVSLRIAHKDYRGIISLIKPFDIGLLKLKTPLRFNHRVHPIKLPEVHIRPKGIANLTGWGSISNNIIINLPDTLQVAEVPLISQHNCEDALRVVAPTETITEIQFCTGPLDGLVSSCLGDSGDPLVQTVNSSEPVQIGITSWAPFPCGSTGSPTVYTLLSAFVYWIQERITEN